MASVFLSYAREEFGKARSLAEALERHGHSVWWDRHIKGGSQYSTEIEAALAKADAVVVLWSEASVGSPWVRDEAAAARDSARLVPVTLDQTAPPMGFRQYQAIDMSAWKGRGKPVNLAALLEAIGSIIGGPSTAETKAPIKPGAFRGFAASRRQVLASIGALLLTLVVVGAFLFWESGKGAQAISMAVLPFDALPADAANTPFAEGVSEEILGELARNPRLRLVGRTSSAMFKDSTADSRTIGGKLGVTYLLDGTVRRAGNEVRVGVVLIRARDGTQLWRNNYRGSLDDIFGIQERIAQGVEGQLRATFAGKAGVTASTLATSGEAYGYYLTARSLIRDREEANTITAIALLRKALRIDPNYAPAWSSLAMAVRFQPVPAGRTATPEELANSQRLSIGYADRALALAPQLAEAHLAKEVSLRGIDGAKEEGGRELQIAARLDPNNAELWNALAQFRSWQGDYVGELNAWRRAVQIDPLWWRAFYFAAETAWQLGYEEEARRYFRRVEREDDRFQAEMVRGSVADWEGDLSRSLKHGFAARAVADSGKRFYANLAIAGPLRSAGYLDQARPFVGLYEVDDTMADLWQGKPPSRSEIARIVSDPNAWTRKDYVIRLLLKALLNSGRSDEVVALYRRRFGTVEGLLPYPTGHASFVEDGTAIAIALREVGEKEEANRLLATIRHSVDAQLRKSRVPRPYNILAAQVAGAQGDTATALRLLEKADSNRWWYAQWDALPDIADEPAFRILKGNPRFEALAARQRAWRAKERREIAPMLAQLGTP